MAARAWLAMTALLFATGAAAADFTYTYPHEARAIPALRARLDAKARRLRTEFVKDQAEDRRSRAKDGIAFAPWSADHDWKRVTDTPRFLSLSETLSSFSGGAHPNTEFDSMLWDKASGIARNPDSLFVSAIAMRHALLPAFCRRLNAERRRRRDGQGDRGIDFDRCDRLMGATLLGSSGHDRFDRIGFLIAPYDAGPYAEGAYEVTLPVTPAVLAAVRPAWRRYFAVGTP